MRKIKALIADDEPHLAAHLESLLKQLWPELEIAATAENGIQALELIETFSPDIAFLDIKMPGMSGIQVAAASKTQCRIVFVTAYDQYAVDAFEQQALDYILKPVSEKRLKQTVLRLKQEIHNENNTEPPDFSMIETLLKNSRPQQFLQHLNIKTGTDIRLVPAADVLFFKAQDKYTTVQCADKEYIMNTPIKKLLEQLDPDKFVQVHRNAIVNLSKIDKLSRSFTGKLEIKFNNCKEKVTVSRPYEKLFRQM